MCACVRFQSCPNELHLTVVKRIFRYLTDTHDLGIFYPIEVSFDLKGYSDMDYVGCKIDCKSSSDT